MINEVDEFFSLDDFAEEATYTVQGSDPKVIRVIYDRASTTQLLIGVEVQSARPQAFAKTADMPNAEKETGSTLLVRETTYNIIEANPDGHGVTTLILSID